MSQGEYFADRGSIPDTSNTRAQGFEQGRQMGEDVYLCCIPSAHFQTLPWRTKKSVGTFEYNYGGDVAEYIHVVVSKDEWYAHLRERALADKNHGERYDAEIGDHHVDDEAVIEQRKLDMARLRLIRFLRKREKALRKAEDQARQKANFAEACEIGKLLQMMNAQKANGIVLTAADGIIAAAARFQYNITIELIGILELLELNGTGRAAIEKGRYMARLINTNRGEAWLVMPVPYPKGEDEFGLPLWRWKVIQRGGLDYASVTIQGLG